MLQGLRNIASLDVAPHPGVNLFHGHNASGKTSLLEAIHILSRGKSFRTHTLSHVVQSGKPGFTVFGQLRGDRKNTVPVGVEYLQRRLRMKAEGAPLRKASQLATHLPLVIIHQESHRLFTEGPKLRRQFLDWGLFHVEQSFHSTWRRYQRALDQRNSSLQQRASPVEIQLWDRELDETGRQIHALRDAYQADVVPLFRHYAGQLLPELGGLGMDYRPGWPLETGLLQSLRENLASDRQRAFTQRGPHRADLRFTVDGVPLRERVSRGQQKLLVCAIYLAQAAVYGKRCGKSCILLVDDVAAELDRSHRDHFLSLLNELRAQVFLTATEAFPELGTEMIQKRFHVEHGRVHEVL